MQQRITPLRDLADDADLLRSWERSLRARNLTRPTIEQYLRSARYLTEWLNGHPLAAVSKEHVEAYLVDTIDRTSPGTAAVRYRCLKQLYRWLADEGEITADPFRGIQAPRTIDSLPPVLSVEQIRAVLAACAGREFADVRDDAMMRLFADTGLRAGGMARLELATVDLDRQLVTVVEKGKERTVPFGLKSAGALDRYLRRRRRHPAAAGPALWLGRAGAMTQSGIYQAVRRRGAMAGLPELHPHVFRHSVAHHWRVNGGEGTDLMELMGWSTPAMLAVYGRSAAAERAREAHKTHGLGDRL